MNELEFCEYYCGELTEEQKAVLGHKIKTNKFLGVARPIGQSCFMPAYQGYPNLDAWNVIDNCGYSQLSSKDGRKLYAPDHVITLYYEDRQSSGLGNRNGQTR